MKKIITLVTIIFSTIFFGCKSNQDQEIKTVVDSFYKNYNVDHNQAKKELLSADLAKLLADAKEKEFLSITAVQKSQYPTDKPNIIERDLFSSLFEGPTSVSVDKIEVKGNRATVTANFKNDNLKAAWQDEIVMVKDQTWKIDNVIYKGESAESMDTKKMLEDYINTP